MLISIYNNQIKSHTIISLTRKIISCGMVKQTLLYKNGLPTSTCRVGLCPKGYSDSTERGCQLVGRPFLLSKKLYSKGLGNIMNDRTKAPKRKIVLEFGSDEFLDAFHSALHVMKEEREAMEKRHNNILDVFMQDIEMFKNDKNR